MGSAQTWLAQRFAKSWFGDANHEANDPSRGARRREIIFAVACAESYLTEWVLEHAGMQGLCKHLPNDDKRGIRQRWKEAATAMEEAGSTAGAPIFGRSVGWGQFSKMIDCRDGLLHARSSRPYQQSHSPRERMVPTVEQLDGVSPGAARDAVASIIEELCRAAGTTPPDWLQAASNPCPAP